MNPMLIGALIGGGAGLLKSELGRKAKADKMRTEAVKAQYSPWTGIVPQDVAGTDTIDATMSGAMSGASFGQGIERQQQDEATQKVYNQKLTSETAKNNAYAKIANLKMGLDENGNPLEEEDGQTGYEPVAGPVNSPYGPYGLMMRNR